MALGVGHLEALELLSKEYAAKVMTDRFFGRLEVLAVSASPRHMEYRESSTAVTSSPSKRSWNSSQKPLL